MTTNRLHRARALGASPYISVTTYKRDGTPLSTPVWVVNRGEFLFIRTRATAGKVKRIGNDGTVLVAVCDSRGRLKGPTMPARAAVVGGGIEDTVEAMMRGKYRWQARFFFDTPWAKKHPVVCVQITLNGDPAEDAIPQRLLDEPATDQ